MCIDLYEGVMTTNANSRELNASVDAGDTVDMVVDTFALTVEWYKLGDSGRQMLSRARMSPSLRNRDLFATVHLSPSTGDKIQLI